jgi:hypothetical protein
VKKMVSWCGVIAVLLANEDRVATMPDMRSISPSRIDEIIALQTLAFMIVNRPV